jgi:hypothetical protein
MTRSPCHDVVSVDRQAGQAKCTRGSVQSLSQGGRWLAAWLTSQYGTHLGQEIEHQGIGRPGGMRSPRRKGPDRPHRRAPAWATVCRRGLRLLIYPSVRQRHAAAGLRHPRETDHPARGSNSSNTERPLSRARQSCRTCGTERRAAYARFRAQQSSIHRPALTARRAACRRAAVLAGAKSRARHAPTIHEPDVGALHCIHIAETLDPA